MIEYMLFDCVNKLMKSFKVLKDYFADKESNKIISGALLIVFILLLIDFLNIPSVIVRKIGSLEMVVLGLIILVTILMRVNVKRWIQSQIWGSHRYMVNGVYNCFPCIGNDLYNIVSIISDAVPRAIVSDNWYSFDIGTNSQKQ